MVITVQCHAQRWSVLDPQTRATEVFSTGAAAFDAAASRASEHHRRTGQHSTVRVEALGTAVDALHFGR